MSTARRAEPSDPRSFTGSPPRRRAVWITVDVTALCLLLTLMALSFLPVYGTAWLFVSVLGFGVVGIAVALLSTWRRLGPALTVAVGVLAWFLFGGFLTMPSSTLGFVVPTPRTLYGLLTGPVTAWRDMLTLAPPIGETFNLLTVPGLVALVSAVAGMLISLRSSKPMLAWVPPALGYLVGAGVGAQVAFRPAEVGVVFFLTVLLWTSYRRSVVRGGLAAGNTVRFRPVRGLMGAATLAVAALISIALVPLVAGAGQRDTVRAAIEPPIDMERYVSPLQGYRANILEHREDTMLSVVGAREGQILRVATLDRYDGLSYTVSSLDDAAPEATTFTRVGQWIADDSAGHDVNVAVTLGSYEGVWVPTLGRTTGIEFTGERRIDLTENFYYNRSSATGLVTTGLGGDDGYGLRARVAERPTDAEIAQAGAGEHPLPEVTDVADQIPVKAKEWSAGQRTAGAAALAIEKTLHEEGYFSHGQTDEGEYASLPGHSERRLRILLSDDYLVGDHEQYAVTMALMARSLNIPARVIYGFEVGASQSVTGSRIGAWPELYLEGLGWVTFNPTPPETRILEDELPPLSPEELPFVENPPPPPMRPEVPPADDQLPIEPAPSPEEDERIDWAQVGAVAALTGIPLITVVLPVALVLGLKARRRARRRGDPVVANRIAGAWSELVDRARDLGRSPSPSATRTEQADALEGDFARLRDVGDPVALAREADWIVFAPGEPSEEAARLYWASTDVIQRGMRRSTNPVRWLLSHLSTKSFRRIR